MGCDLFVQFVKMDHLKKTLMSTTMLGIFRVYAMNSFVVSTFV